MFTFICFVTYVLLIVPSVTKIINDLDKHNKQD